MKNLYVAALFALIFFSNSSFAGAAYAIVPSAGAVFDSATGIIPQATPYTFSASAANDGVVAARSIPVAANTPYGAVSGNVKTAGIISKPVAASLGKSLMRLNLPVQIGMALYDAYQASNMSVDANGTVLNPPVGFSQYVLPGLSFTSLGAAMAAVGATGIYSTSVPAPGASCGFGGAAQMCYVTTNWYVIAVPVTASPGAATPASLAQKDAAIDTFANTTVQSDNAVRLASAAYAAQVSLPSISVVGLQSPPVSLLTPWQTVGTTTDANGNKLSVQKQAQVDILPSTAPLSTTDSPLPVRITENTQTINSANAPVSSATSLLAHTQPGSTASPAVTPQTPADLCKDHPDASACAALGEGSLPVETIGTKSVDVSQNMGHFSFAGAGACPADKTVALGMGATSIKVSYTPLCTFLGIFRIAALAMGLFVSGLIVMGQRASDGAA